MSLSDLIVLGAVLVGCVVFRVLAIIASYLLRRAEAAGGYGADGETASRRAHVVNHGDPQRHAAANELTILPMGAPNHLVAAGYDAMAARFDEWQKEVSGSPRMRYLDARHRKRRWPSATAFPARQYRR